MGATQIDSQIGHLWGGRERSEQEEDREERQCVKKRKRGEKGEEREEGEERKEVESRGEDRGVGVPSGCNSTSTNSNTITHTTDKLITFAPTKIILRRGGGLCSVVADWEDDVGGSEEDSVPEDEELEEEDEGKGVVLPLLLAPEGEWLNTCTCTSARTCAGGHACDCAHIGCMNART